MEDKLSDVELWQKSEDERLEYEGYCNKIRKGLEDLDEKSGERALWELVQNARDMSSESRIKIELTDTNIIFSHLQYSKTAPKYNLTQFSLHYHKKRDGELIIPSFF